MKKELKLNKIERKTVQLEKEIREIQKLLTSKSFLLGENIGLRRLHEKGCFIDSSGKIIYIKRKGLTNEKD